MPRSVRLILTGDEQHSQHRSAPRHGTSRECSQPEHGALSHSQAVIQSHSQAVVLVCCHAVCRTVRQSVTVVQLYCHTDAQQYVAQHRRTVTPVMCVCLHVTCTELFFAEAFRDRKKRGRERKERKKRRDAKRRSHTPEEVEHCAHHFVGEGRGKAHCDAADSCMPT